MKQKSYLYTAAIVAFLAVLFMLFIAGGCEVLLEKNNFTHGKTLRQYSRLDAKNGTYIVEDRFITLKNGYYENMLVPGSAIKEIIRYFGNEVTADFNNDGVADTAFLLTRDAGGSGTFYYVAAQLSSGQTFIGSNAIFIGDRIAPQTTEFRNGQIIVNYAERKPGESFAVVPSVGVSKYYQVINNELREAKTK